MRNRRIGDNPWTRSRPTHMGTCQSLTLLPTGPTSAVLTARELANLRGLSSSMTGEEATLALAANCPTSRATNCTSLRGGPVSARIHSKTMKPGWGRTMLAGRQGKGASGTRVNGPGGGSRTHTGSDPRQILSLLRLPVPPLRESVELIDYEGFRSLPATLSLPRSGETVNEL